MTLRTLILASVFGCACKPSPESLPMVDLLDSLDDNRNGAVEEDEWNRRAYAAPTFMEVDQNGDGRLNGDELLEHILTTDPSTFDGDHPRGHPTPTKLIADFPIPRPVRHLRDLLLFTREEILAIDPNQAVPSEHELQAAADAVVQHRPGSEKSLQSLHIAAMETSTPWPSVLPRFDQPGAEQ